MQRDLKPRAVELRKQGKTFSEIQAILGQIPKGTLSGWLKPILLTEIQKKRILEKIKKQGHVGRMRGAWRNHEKRLERIDRISSVAKLEYKTYSQDPLFLPGLVLYLAEGSKKTESFQFMNSDYQLIKIMINWITKFGGHEFANLRFRLYIHKIYAHENHESFWIRVLRADESQMLKTIYKPTNRTYKKNPSYKGCLRIEVIGNELYWKTMTWRDCLYASL